MRAGLPLGVTAAQLVHAAGESFGWQHIDCDCVATPGANRTCTICRGTGRRLPIVHAVVLAAPSEAALYAVAAALNARGLGYRLIQEPDPPFLGEATAIGIGPVADKKLLPAIVRRLPLLGA